MSPETLIYPLRSAPGDPVGFAELERRQQILTRSAHQLREIGQILEELTAELRAGNDERAGRPPVGRSRPADGMAVPAGLCMHVVRSPA